MHPCSRLDKPALELGSLESRVPLPMCTVTSYYTDLIHYCGAIKNKEKETPNEMLLLHERDSVLGTILTQSKF